MTLVSVRLDDTFGSLRLSALADTRASFRTSDKTWKTISDTTVKLFAVPVRCYELKELNLGTGAWENPYFETLIGIGFSGSCFEALTVIAHINQSLSALVDPNGEQPRPSKDGIINLISRLTEGYFANHSTDGDPKVFMLVFGFDDKCPWIGKVICDKKAKADSCSDWADVKTLETVGQDSRFQQYATELRQQIQKHRDSVRSKKTGKSNEEGAFQKDLMDAQHAVSDKKITEEEMLRQIESEYVDTIGGVLQRLELSLDGECVVASFSRDDRPYLDGAQYSVAPNAHLGPIPIIEKMGRRIRKPNG